jgi:hypothetical protein
MLKVGYIHSPKVQIRNQGDLIPLKWVDLPHIVFHTFNVPEIQDQVPAIINS